MPPTGPRTPAGKARSNRNAWKHGIRAKAFVLPPIEKVADWTAHRDGIFESLQPEGHLEFMLAERVAIALWKLRRLEYHQVSMARSSRRFALRHRIPDPKVAEKLIAHGAAEFPDLEGVPSELLHLEMTGLIPDGYSLPGIMRYEAHLHRQCIQTLHELEAMQSRRKGEATPLARLDIVGSPGAS